MFRISNRKIMRKKKMWPTVLLFCLLLAACAGSVAAAVAQYRVSAINSRLENLQQDRMRLGRILEKLAEENGSTSSELSSADWKKILQKINDYEQEDLSLCITDADHKIISSLGQYQPDFEKSAVVELKDKFTYYGDNTSEAKPSDNKMKIGGRRMDFAGEHKVTLLQYLFEGGEIFQMQAWNEVPVKISGIKFFCRNSVTVSQSGMEEWSAGASVVAVVFAVPVIFLLCYVLSVVRSQRKATALLWLDPVTGGNNWLYFTNRVQEIAGKRVNRHRQFALVNIHVRRYQDYCACYGGDSGNELLGRMDAYFRVRVQETETYGHFSQADFGLLLIYTSREEMERRIRKMLSELSGIIEDTSVSVQAGIHVLERGEIQAEDVSQAYHLAEVARITGLEKSDKKYAFFEEEIIQEHKWHHQVVDGLDAAIRNEEFVVYFQPKYCPETGKMVGAEALVRWQSADGMIPPGRFIPILEESGGIVKLDDFMISQVAKIQTERKLQGLPMIPISVNVSRKHFVQADLAEHICQLVDVYGADRKLIEIEVTESAFMEEQDMLLQTLLKLRSYGFVISMDDFGAGYSSLNSLKELPIDVLKLDMAFFRGEDEEGKSRVIVEAAIWLAKKLNIRVVAEGIETEEQVEFLKKLECEMIQGYYYARPMPRAEFKEMADRDI